MNCPRLFVIGAAVLASGCSSYVLPVPAGLTPAVTMQVQGATGFQQKHMRVGDYEIAIDRGTTYHYGPRQAAVASERKRQSYSFAMRRAGVLALTGGCLLSADEMVINAPAGFEVTASEKAELECELLPGGQGSESWRLELAGKPDAPMTGTYRANSNYEIEGIGAAIGSTRHGPTVGYYIRQSGSVVATVQVSGDRQVLFAEGQNSDALVGAAAVLLLIDESVRSLD